MNEPRMIIVPPDAGELAIRRGLNNPIAMDAPAAINGNGSHTTGWQRIDLTDDRYAIPPTPPDLHPLIYSGLRHALSGPPEATKTLLSYSILLDIIRAGRPVAIVDFEMGANAARILLDELGATPADLNRIHYHQDVEGPPTDADIAALKDAHVALVLIDSSVGAFDASGLDDNARKDVEAWAKAWIRPLFSIGIATLVLDHVTKNADTRGKFTIGSERKTGGVDIHLGAEPVNQLKRGGQAIVKIRTHKDRRGFLERPHAFVAELHSHAVTHAITVTLKAAESTDEEGHFRPTHLMQAVSRYLETLGEPATRNQIEQNVKGKNDYKRAAIDTLIRESYAVEQVGARGARIVTLQRPYRQETDPQNDLAPPRPDLAPGEVETTSPLAPPYRGEGEVDSARANTPPRPRGEVMDDQDQAFLDHLEIERLEALARTYGVDEDDDQ